MKLLYLIILNIQLLHYSHADKVKKHCSNNVCIPPDYEKVNPPFLNETNWMEEIVLNKIKILKVDDIEQIISLTLEIYLTWKEPRLEVNTTFKKSEWDYFSLEKSFQNKLWIPDLYIYDANSVRKNHITSSYESLLYTPSWSYYWPDLLQTLTYCVMLNVEIICHNMRFESYPFDWHTCYFEMSSYTYSREIFDFKKIKISQLNTSVSDFFIKVDKLSEEKYFSKRNYSKTGFKMTLRRKFDKYKYNCYIPSGLMVMISWISFVIPPQIVPGRMGLLITLLLLLVNLFISTAANIPNTNSLTPISIWVLACIIYVQLAILEYGCILLFKHIKNYPTPEFGKNIFHRVDLLCLSMSIVSFVIFSYMYWNHFMPKT